jgi:hypothetical protein
MKEEVRYARQLFLHGDGTAGPIKNVETLATKAGCSTRALRDHLPEWRQEAEELSIRSKNSPFSLELSSAALAQHREEIDFLAQQVRKLRARLKKTPTNSPNYPVYLSCYNSAFTKWEKSSGIMGQYDVALASMKETARAAARARAKQSDDEGDGRTPAPVKRDRFDVEG